MMYSINDLVILETYKQGQGLREEVQNGFARVAQKVTLVGLKVLVSANLSDQLIPAGSIAYLPEDLLMTQAWAKQTRKADFVDQDFIIVEKRHIVGFKEIAEENI